MKISQKNHAITNFWLVKQIDRCVGWCKWVTWKFRLSLDGFGLPQFRREKISLVGFYGRMINSNKKFFFYFFIILLQNVSMWAIIRINNSFLIFSTWIYLKAATLQLFDYLKDWATGAQGLCRQEKGSVSLVKRGVFIDWAFYYYFFL